MATVAFGEFEWDDRKAARNLEKHGVSFEEALTALADPHAIEGESMKKVDPAKLPEGHLARYDWAKARRGRLAGKAAKATELLRILDPDLGAHFPDSRAVNEALRALLAIDAALPRRRTGRRRAA